jgi:cathepsin D
LFAFYLKRYRNVAGASNLESDGGTVTFGALGKLQLPPACGTKLITDSSLYTGSITYVDVTDDSQYWEIPMQSKL